MRTLIESILDDNLDAHDEAVFTEQIRLEITKHLPSERIPQPLYEVLNKMTIKVENGNRVFFIKDKSTKSVISTMITRVLEEYNVREIRAEGTLSIITGLTNFNISASSVVIFATAEDMTFTKCNITCDELSVDGYSTPEIECNQCKIKTKVYSVSRRPIKFNNSKITGLHSVELFLSVDVLRWRLKELPVGYSIYDGFYPLATFDIRARQFDPLEELVGIQKITKLPNIYFYANGQCVKKHEAGMIFKSPRTPIDKQIARCSRPKTEMMDCLNGYQVYFTHFSLH